RGGKGYQWEGGIREPYFIKVPWLDNGGSQNDFPVIGTDFYPTLLDLAVVDLLPEQHIDGISLKPILEGREMDVDRPLFWHYPHYGNQGGNPSSIIREKNWKLIHYWEDGNEELYDLASDPGEQFDVSTSNPGITKELSNKLLGWLEEVGANMPINDIEFDPKLADKRHERTVKERWPALEAQRIKFLSEDYRPNEDWWGSKVTKD